MDFFETTSVPQSDRNDLLAAPSEEHWARRTIGHWTWQVRQEWAFLLDERAPQWTALQQDPRASQVKVNEGRQVWRVQTGAHLVFAKITRPARWARFRRLIMGSDSAREYRIARYAAEHQIQTVCPVAMGNAPISGRTANSILITIGLPHARPLNEFWEALNPNAPGMRHTKNIIIDAVARMIAHAHQNGFEHFDLHAGNVLIDVRGPDLYRPLFVDLHNVRIARPVSDAKVTRNLAQFNQWFRIHAPVSDRVRFLKRYLHWRDALQSAGAYGRRLQYDLHEIMRLMNRAAATHARALYAKRDRRILRSGRYFTKVQLAGGWRAHVFLECKHPVPGSRSSSLAFTAQQWKDWLRQPLDWVQVKDRRDLIKDSATAVVCRATLPHPSGPLPVICKRTTCRNVLKRLQYLFRTSRPMHTWKRGHALLHRQIPTARPLAVLERRQWGLLLDSLLITEHIEHAYDLDTLLTVQMRDMPPAKQRRLKEQLTESLVRVIHHLESRGFSHRDLKAPNVIVQWDAALSHPPQILLVDLDGVHRLRGCPLRARWNMLARLNVSLDHCRRVTLSDRIRFLKRYLQRVNHSDASWKTVWKQLAELSARKREVREREQQRKFEKYGRF